METKERFDTVLKCDHYTGIDQVGPEQWDSVVPRATGLKHSILSVFEHSGINDLVCHYLLYHSGDESVGRANVYEVSMDFKSMDQSMSGETVEAINRWHPEFLNFSMAECGLFAMNGDGLVADTDRRLPSVIAQTSEKLHQIADQKGLDLLVFRDVPIELFPVYEKILAPQGYAPAAGFTNAVLDINWTSLDDYLNDLKSKDRHKIKTAFKKQKELGLHVEITSDYAHLAAEMASLWANVNASSSDYNREQLDENFFREAGNRIKENSEVVLFYQGESLVAFMWNLIGEEDYHMADWGVDYDYPNYREANFYRAASVYSLERAIELKKQRMQLGMTNYVPKKFLGARMQPLVYFIKHLRNPDHSGTVARMMTDAIEQPESLDYFSETTGFSNPMSDAEYKSNINRRVRDYTPEDILSGTEENYDVDLLKVGGMYSFYPDNHSAQLDFSTPRFNDFTRFAEIAQRGAAVLTHSAEYCSGPAFLSGHSGSALILQDLLADLTAQQGSQLFANASALYASVFGAIMTEQSAVFIDEQCNPLLVMAAAATGKPMHCFGHGDYTELESLIEENKDRQALIVTESVFGLFGDEAPLQQLVEIKKRAGARLYVDESTAFGSFGKKGEGHAGHRGMLEHVDILSASFYAGLGLPGAFVSGPEKLIEHVRHQSPELILSPSISNVDATMMIESLKLLQQGGVDRAGLSAKADRLASALSVADYRIIRGSAPIVSVVIGDYTLALAMQKKLFKQNIVVSTVGPPMVPEEISCLQLRINNSIEDSAVDRVISAFELMASDLYGK